MEVLTLGIDGLSMEVSVVIPMIVLVLVNLSKWRNMSLPVFWSHRSRRSPLPDDERAIGLPRAGNVEIVTRAKNSNSTLREIESMAERYLCG